MATIGLVAPLDTPLDRIVPLVLDAALQVSRELFPGVRRTRARTLEPVD